MYSGYFPDGFWATGYWPDGYWSEQSGEIVEVIGVVVATIPSPFAVVRGVALSPPQVGGWFATRPRPLPAVIGTVCATVPSPFAEAKGEYQKFSDEQIEEIIAALLMAA